MANEKKVEVIGDYKLSSWNKVFRIKRVLKFGPNGSNQEEAKMKQVADAIGDDDKALLALYDRAGGAIWKNGEKVERGMFWDYKNNKPFEGKASKEKEDDEEAPEKKQGRPKKKSA